MPIRKAETGDVTEIALLAAKKREKYEEYHPQFHRESPQAFELHSMFLRDALAKENMVVLASETGGKVDGFIIGNLLSAPPVYQLGGKICLVDDFMVERPELWATVGRELLTRVMEWTKGNGAVLANVVCGPLDNPKKALLIGEAFSVATEWHVKPIV